MIIFLGMAYPNAGEVCSHGKLKSSNCVLDSLCVLKIIDFELHEILRGEDEGDFAKYVNTFAGKAYDQILMSIFNLYFFVFIRIQCYRFASAQL